MIDEFDYPELDLVDDYSRTCDIDELIYHEDYGERCGICDIWICNNCWPEHTELTKHTKDSK